MSKVIYAWAGSPQMPDAALHLQRTIGWDPVLWISYANQEDRVKTLFPSVPWQNLEDAFVGIPIDSLNSSQPRTLDGELLIRLQKYLPRLMNQMNRFGPPERFLYDERESFARDLLFQWHEVLERTEAEIVFFEEPPNSPYNYSIHILCQEMGIRTVYLNATSIPELTLVREQIESPPLRLLDSYHARLGGETADELPESIQTAVAKITEGQDFSHWYMEQQREFDAKVIDARQESPTGASRILRMCIHGLRFWKWPLIFKNIVFHHIVGRFTRKRRLSEKTECLRIKFPGVPLGTRECALGDLLEYHSEATAIKTKLRADYLARCVPVDCENDAYVYFPLHYRPERTSNPDGGVFYDQIIPLAMISEALPDGWHIYVKEHPSQFSMMLGGESGRTTEYYDQIARLKGVKFIDPDYSSKALLQASQAAGTITGTIAWEAALNGKPAFYFGHPWYQGCPGTYQVSSATEVSHLLSTSGSRGASTEEIEAFLHALSDATFRYVQNGWTFDPPLASSQQQFEGIVRALEWWHRERFAVSNHSLGGLR